MNTGKKSFGKWVLIIVGILIAIYLVGVLFIIGRAKINHSFSQPISAEEQLAQVGGGGSKPGDKPKGSGEDTTPSEPIKECKVYNGFTGTLPLWNEGSKLEVSNGGGKVTVNYEVQGPTILLPWILTDLRIAMSLTTTDAELACKTEKWNNVPCIFDAKVSKAEKVSAGFTTNVQQTVTYTCDCFTGSGS